MRRALVGAAAVAAAGVLAAGGAAQASVVTVGANSVDMPGTGRVIAGGASALIDVSVTCPKGDTWAVGDSGFGFAEIGLDDTFASADAGQSGKCTGKAQKVKVRITYVASSHPTIPRNCSAEYLLSFVFSDGSQIDLTRGIAAPVTGPLLCLS